ncbi:prephenate/arogenate dehydrogenase family protein [Sandarakinorhabdus limnophila]|jgi:cyclohexadieny/prephenate dehydrogenase|uniref:prephenate/arogenate dehydrogenase family protein n=1 Tax=Sandarakinorhabdus limnophila TaxID=210512 RepID=UPI0003B5E402|nr:prephenate/arogenate dehydrogenase family protein [Sandarakinorhabdus limnophila]MCM0033110.1 prephenate/arogenate dehydrogenase family protein [Sandarakinorhabdus limnophila]
MLPFARVAIIGMGLIGSSLARAVREAMPTVQLTVSDASAAVRERVAELGIADDVADGAGAAVVDADLVILCVPVGAMAEVAAEIGPELAPDTVVSDVGSVKESVLKVLGAALPGVHVIPAHPVAGTEKSGPDAGFSSLFKGRWCIITPPPRADEVMVERLSEFWRRLGAKVDLMDAPHHDRVLAVTSHLPHLIAYSIVGTASDLEQVTKAEVIKYSAGGFRDFTRIAASDPVMWRDVFLNNREAVLELLGRFTEDLVALQRAIRWGEGDTLENLFTRTRAIRRQVIDEGQDTDKPDFGR